MKNIEICGVFAEPGQCKMASIPVAIMPRGDTLQIPVKILSGTQPGPVLGLVCTSHGDETFPILVFEEAFKRIDLKNLKGAIVCIPVLNPVAFESGTRLTGLEMTTEAVNMNLVFPGNKNASLISRMAYEITENFLSQIEYLADYHGGAIEKAIDYILVDCADPALLERSKTLAIAYGTSTIVISDGSKSDKLDTSITAIANRKGIPSIIPMCGGFTLVGSKEFLNRQVEHLLNVLRQLGMIEGPLAQFCKKYIYTDRLLFRHNQGGLFLPSMDSRDIGKVVPQDTLLGITISPYTFEILEEYRAPYELTTMISVRAMFSRVSPGEYAFIVADASTRITT